MLDYLLLSNKPTVTITNSAGESYQCKDLLHPVAMYNNVDIDDVFIINEHYVARPDLVSLAVYGDDRYADVLCKFNGLANPFELNENMVIFIPPLSRLNEMFNPNGRRSEMINDSESNTFSGTQYPMQKEKSEKRSPAESVVGETNFVVDRTLGVVFY